MDWKKNQEKVRKRERGAQRKDHIAGLDGLRGIGVLGVILFHMFPVGWKGGYAGVLLFFVLSGYLLAFTSLRSAENGSFSVKIYYKKRIERIFPPLFAMVFITLGFLTLLAPKILIGIRGEILSIFLGYNNFWQIGQNASYFTRISNASPFTHLWFLAIEMQFYLIWPLIFTLYYKIKKGRCPKAAGAVVLIPALLSLAALAIYYVPGEDVTRVYYGTDTRIFSMFFGAYLGLQRAEKKNRLQKKTIGSYGKRTAGGFWKTGLRKIAAAARSREKPLFAVSVVLVFAVYLLMDGEAELTYRFGLFAVSLFFGGLIYLVADPGSSLGRALDATPLAWIGKRSYEIYLWQYPVIFLFQYYKLDRYWICILLILILITILSLWTEVVLRWMRERITFGGKRMRYVKKSVFGLMTVILMFAFVLGGCSLFTASDDDGGEQKQLESELEKNSKELEEQQKREEQQKQEQQKEEQKGQTAEDGFITAVGDSVMLGAAPSLQETLPGCVVDAAESRQVVKAKAIVENLKSQGKLGSTVVLGLGTNGPFKTSVGQELLDAIGSDKTVYWVNVYGAHLRWQDEVNATISELVQKNDNVHMIDWASQAAAHPEWIYNDGIHLKPAGQEAYARLVFQSIAEE